ncbi:MAG: hypothetical protein LBB76_12395, partial [Azoarcus sp.]|nr:hypothetical protein [Azoarcus sp.]
MAQLPFPADPAEHAAWYREINNRIEALGAFISAFRNCEWGDDSLLFDTGERTETAKPFPFNLKTLYVIADDFPPEALPFLRQCALRVCARDRWNGKEEGYWNRPILGMYAALAGADAVDDLLDEWRKMPPITSITNNYYPDMYRHIAILLVLTAPPHRYPELARILRTIFNAIGRQEKGKYGEETSGMRTLGTIAYALAIFDPKSAPAIKARSSEYGIFWRNVQWGLAG